MWKVFGLNREEVKNRCRNVHSEELHNFISSQIYSVKDSVQVPPLPMSLKELRDRITHALQTITADMLHRVWDEFDYREDVCRVTQGAHIEGL
jgi:hypothetical protein